MSWLMDRGKQQAHHKHFRTEPFSRPVIPAQAGIQAFVIHPFSSFDFGK